jgi:aldehyde dehydrogenase (NAD+)
MPASNVSSDELPKYRNLIDGKWVAASGNDWFDSFNPFTGTPWARVARSTPEDVNRAVGAATRAFNSSAWRGLTASERGRLLYRLGDLIAEQGERLAQIETRDNGKLITEMRTQLRNIPSWFRYFGGLADKLEGRVIPIEKAKTFNFTRLEPIGVVAAITPWNSPLMLAAWKLAPALAAGNTIVWKPSEFSSVSALEFGRLFEEAGFPPGVVNIVAGFGSEIGETLVTHPNVAKVAFTGGDATGEHVNKLAAAGLKTVTLELGGKSANIVFPDANVDNAVKGIVSGIFAATGQTCIAGSRALVHRSLLDQVTEGVIDLAKTARMGDPMLDTTQVGPITTQPQFTKVLGHIEAAKGEGARCLLGGEAASRPECGSGWFVEPTIFSDVRNDMRIAQDEVFGPVLAIIPFDDDDEAVAVANDTQYGLASGVWTESISRALQMSERLQSGTVWINTYRAVSYMSPFGGYKRSGIGRENGLSAIRHYVQEKSVWIDMGNEVANPFVMR